LIVRKGEAAPAIVTPPVAVANAAPSEIATVSQSGPPVPKGLAGTIAITVRLDPERYERLKVYGARRRQSNQHIMVAALDAYLPPGDHE
jgi:hypothetical protein